MKFDTDMATLYLTEPHTLVKKDGDALVVHIPANEEKDQPKRKVKVPLINVDRVVIQGNSTLTTPAIIALLDKKAEVAILDRYGHYKGHISPGFTRNGQLRLAQTAYHNAYTLRIPLASQFIRGKLHNMRTMLLRFNRKHKAEQITLACERIKQSITQLDMIDYSEVGDDPSKPQKQSAYGRILGIEGNGTSHYFSCWKTILNEPDFFNGRTRRPPRDQANSLLSYGYTILLNQVVSAISTVGMDTHIGYLHSETYGKPALALDLMEEFRPIIVDSVVIKLINQQSVKDKDFINEFGAYRFTDYTRKTFLSALEARLDETITHPTFGYKTTYRNCIELQARLVAKTVMGEIDQYPPFLIR